MRNVYMKSSIEWISANTELPPCESYVLVTTHSKPFDKTYVYPAIRLTDRWMICAKDFVQLLYDGDNTETIITSWAYFPEPYINGGIKNDE